MPARPLTDDAIRQLLLQMFEAAVQSAQPAHCLPPHLPDPPHGRTWVIGAGKAAAAMAAALESHWHAPLGGLVVTRYGHRVPTRSIEVIEAGHPVPDAAGCDAARRMLESVHDLDADDLVICLISGGGSALLPLPLPGITLEEEQSLARALLASGADIHAMNCVRRHLSAIKGGRLAAACAPARLITLAISDIPGDDPCDIASGPTVGDPTTCADALAILERFQIPLPASIRATLESGAGESIKPDDPRLAKQRFELIATPRRALEAAAAVARAAGLTAHILGDALEGEAVSVAQTLAAIARSVAQYGEPFAAPCVLLSGGETTVTVRGNGIGGRNVEFLLSLALALGANPRIHAFAGDTDGVDGGADVAGAWVSPNTLERARAAGLDARASLARNDAHPFFARLGDAHTSGPTLTNVNDFRALIIRAPD
jgi:hydroxypyruvate reductase